MREPWWNQKLWTGWARREGPGDLVAGGFGEAGVGELFEVDLAVQHTRLDHHADNEFEVGLIGRERRVHDAVERIGKRPLEQRRVLTIIVAADKLRGGLTVGLALLQPKA